MQNRRIFLKNASIGTAILPFASLFACTAPTPKEQASNVKKEMNPKSLKISLAQWSLNRAFFANELDAKDFASIAANTYGIKAVEYVNGFYKESVANEQFWLDMKNRSNQAGVENLLIMVDDEGDLGNPDAIERKKAVENHYKWVNAAKLLGCHSIRVNAFGEGEKSTIKAALTDGMGQLCDYAAKENINVLIENHGLYSSDGKFIVGIIQDINKPNMGTLPDFGNWCLNAKWGSTQNNKCDQVYDRYQGITDFLPYAKGVSAKSYNFNDKGEDTVIDYYKMLKIVKESNFDGYIGIEYEGEEKGEDEGIRITKALLEKVWKSI